MDDDDDDNDDNDECDDPQNRRATKPARKIVGVGVRLARRRRRRLEKRRLCFERTNKEEDEDVGEKNDDGRK